MIIVSMVVRNEADRYLSKVLANIAQIKNALLCVTDDASDDDTPRLLQEFGAEVRLMPRPMFWEHEGRFRQAHHDWISLDYATPGDWILALDADETVSHPEALHSTVEMAERHLYGAIGLPLYEFWSPTEYRVDGYWFGTRTPRLYRWSPGGMFRMAEMGCGSEPHYVATSNTYFQNEHKLLHWGYASPDDRPRKQAAYLARLNGHGHNNSHILSITQPPTLRSYSDD